jgi:hypothetical protein
VISIATLWKDIEAFCTRFSLHQSKLFGATRRLCLVRRVGRRGAMRVHLVRILRALGDDVVVMRRLTGDGQLKLPRTTRKLLDAPAGCARVDDAMIANGKFDPSTLVVGAALARRASGARRRRRAGAEHGANGEFERKASQVALHCRPHRLSRCSQGRRGRRIQGRQETHLLPHQASGHARFDSQSGRLASGPRQRHCHSLARRLRTAAQSPARSARRLCCTRVRGGAKVPHHVDHCRYAGRNHRQSRPASPPARSARTASSSFAASSSRAATCSSSTPSTTRANARARPCQRARRRAVSTAGACSSRSSIAPPRAFTPTPRSRTFPRAAATTTPPPTALRSPITATTTTTTTVAAATTTTTTRRGCRRRRRRQRCACQCVRSAWRCRSTTRFSSAFATRARAV